MEYMEYMEHTDHMHVQDSGTERAGRWRGKTDGRQAQRASGPWRTNGQGDALVVQLPHTNAWSSPRPHTLLAKEKNLGSLQREIGGRRHRTPSYPSCYVRPCAACFSGFSCSLNISFSLPFDHFSPFSLLLFLSAEPTCMEFTCSFPFLPFVQLPAPTSTLEQLHSNLLTLLHTMVVLRPNLN